MTSRELEYIKTVADEKSISSAARKLYIAQPSLSQSLQRIEENLGAKLFNRTPSGLTLTYAGERCYQMACQVLKIYSDFEAEISDINQLKTGRIVMGKIWKERSVTSTDCGPAVSVWASPTTWEPLFSPKYCPHFADNVHLLNWRSWRTIREIWKQNFLPALWILLFSMPRSWLQILY